MNIETLLPTLISMLIGLAVQILPQVIQAFLDFLSQMQQQA
ncbi:MAG TPA: hypothetical protein VMV94_18065 [Phycisphaerae bacterium]|nr:hypothetical protein [Phycisphaerae bacterium]